MIQQFDDYTLLAGNRGKRGSLWQGPDHLLVVEGQGIITPFREHYKRIDYKNIQALILVRTATWIWIALALAVPMIGLFWLAFYNLEDGILGITPVAGTMAVALLVWLIVHLSLGQTCRCAVQTAVQSLRLRPLKREKHANKVLLALQGLCQLHQGEMPDPATMAAARFQQQPLPTGMKSFWPGSSWVTWSSICMLIWGVALAAEFFVEGAALTITGVVAGGLAFIFTLVAMVQAYQHICPGALMVGLWMGIILQTLAGLGLYIAFAAISFGGRSGSDVGFSDSVGFYMRSFELSDLSMDQTHGAGWIAVVLGAALILAAVMILPHGFRRRLSDEEIKVSTPPAAPPPVN